MILSEGDGEDVGKVVFIMSGCSSELITETNCLTLPDPYKVENFFISQY